MFVFFFSSSFILFIFIGLTLLYTISKFLCTTLYLNFCIHYVLTTRSLVSIHPHTVDPLYPFYPPLMPSLLVTASLFSVSVGLFLVHLVCSFVLVLFYIPHMSEIVQCLSFFIWLISLSIILSRTIFQKDIYTSVFTTALFTITKITGGKKTLSVQWWWMSKEDVVYIHSGMLLLLLSRFSCVQLCDPIDGSPPGSPVPGILQARALEWAAISFFKAWKWKVEVKSLSRVRLLATPWTAAHQVRLWDFPGESTGVGCYCPLHSGMLLSHKKMVLPSATTLGGLSSSCASLSVVSQGLALWWVEVVPVYPATLQEHHNLEPGNHGPWETWTYKRTRKADSSFKVCRLYKTNFF